MITQEGTHGKAERRILIGMITHRQVLAKISEGWDSKQEMFHSKWADVVGNLCVRFYQTYGKSPGPAIESEFETWSTRRNRDQATVELVSNFLSSLSQEYLALKQQINPAQLIDRAADHFNLARLQRHAARITAFAGAGELKEAASIALRYKELNFGADADIDLLEDELGMELALKAQEEPLLTFSDGLGKFYGHTLRRGGFVSYLAPEKVGKTTELVDMAWRAMTQRHRVAFFSLGDESEEDMRVRFAVRATRHPMILRADGMARFPTAITPPKEKGEPPVVQFEDKKFESRPTLREIMDRFAETKKQKLRSDQVYLKMRVYRGNTVSMRDIDRKLEEWASVGWPVDVAVIDYMENLLESGNPRDDPRFRISATWADARGVAMKHRCLVLTATQANAEGNDAVYLTRNHFSESKTKLAHVTGMAGINQTENEKMLGVSRLNWVVRRGDFFLSRRQCWRAGHYGVQNPSMRSVF